MYLGRRTSSVIAFAVGLVVASGTGSAGCIPPGINATLAMGDPLVRACLDRQLLTSSPNAHRDFYEARRTNLLLRCAFVDHEPACVRALSEIR